MACRAFTDYLDFGYKQTAVQRGDRGRWGCGLLPGAGGGGATAPRDFHCRWGHLQPEIRPEHLLVLVLLEPVQVLLPQEGPEEAVRLALDRDSSVGADGGYFLLHSILGIHLSEQTYRMRKTL